MFGSAGSPASRTLFAFRSSYFVPLALAPLQLPKSSPVSASLEDRVTSYVHESDDGGCEHVQPDWATSRILYAPGSMPVIDQTPLPSVVALGSPESRDPLAF